MDPIHHEVYEIIEMALFVVGKQLNININLKYGFMCKTCQNTKEAHMTYLLKNDCHYCYCAEEKSTKLESLYDVWLPTYYEVNAYICILIY